MVAMIATSVLLGTGIALIPGDLVVGSESPGHGVSEVRIGLPGAERRSRSPGPAEMGAGADSLLTVARLRYGGGGDWYADPSSLPNLLREIRERTGLPVAEDEAVVAPGGAALRDYPYLYLTGHGNVRFTAAEREALREHLLSGGFLHADDNYGMDESFRREIQAVFPDKELVPIPADHPVFHTFYEFPEGLPKIHEHDGEPPEALGIFHRGRLVVFYSRETDLGDGWEDPDVHENPEAVRDRAFRMGVNLFLYVLAQEAS